MFKFGILLFLFVYRIQSEELSDFPTFDEDASSWQRLKEMVETLRESAKKGAKELKEKLDSEYIKEQLKKLSSFYRTIASKFLKKFQEVLSKIENKIRPYSSDVVPTQIENSIQSLMKEIELIKDTTERDFINGKHSIKFEILYRLIVAFRSLGYEYLHMLINAKEFVKICDGLDIEEKEELIQLIKDLNIPDQAKDSLASYSREYLDLRSRILAMHSKGKEFLLKFINSKGYSEVLEGLRSHEKQEILDLVQQLTGVAFSYAFYSAKFLELQTKLIQDHDNGKLDLNVIIKDLPNILKDFEEHEKAEIYNLIARLTIM